MPIRTDSGLAAVAAQIAREEYVPSRRRGAARAAEQKVPEAKSHGTAPPQPQHAAEMHQADVVASAAAAVGAALQKQTEQLVHEARLGAADAASAGGSVDDRLTALERRVARLQRLLDGLLRALHGRAW